MVDAIRSVADMAALAELSPRQLQRKLKELTGFAPHDFLKVLRVQQSFRKHYLDLKDPAEAELFFGIMPTRKPTPVPVDECAESTAPLPFPTPEKAERKAS